MEDLERVAQVVVCSLGIFALACGGTGGYVVDETTDEAEDEAEEDMSEAIASDIRGELGPATVHEYTMQLFRALYYHGGYDLPVSRYEEGEWTRWRGEGEDRSDIYAKVLFDVRDDGSEWWRVETKELEDEEVTSEYIAEALLAPVEDGDRDILRLRVKYPDEEEPSEIPVTEEDSEEWAVEADRELTEESLEGMHQGTETVETPAGTFESERYETSHYGRADDVNWWLSDEVPGEVVKFNEVDDDDLRYEMILDGYGGGVTDSELGVFEEDDEEEEEDDE